MESDDSWLIRDTVTDGTIRVVQFSVNDRAARLTLASSPLARGRTYETMDYDPSVTAGEGVAFRCGDVNEGIVLGISGDDLIDRGYGGDPNGNRVDANDQYTAATTQQTFRWSQYADNQNLAGGATQTHGGIQVSVTTDLASGATFAADTSTKEGAFYAPGDSNISTQSSAKLFVNGNATDSTLTFESAADASAEVHNVLFVINDIDGVKDRANDFQDIVTVRAYDVDANEVAVDLDVLGHDSAKGNTITARINYDKPDQQDGAVRVTIAGPVDRIVITYDNGSPTQQAIHLSDIDFDVTASDGDADNIDAGAGNDTVFAGSGDDLLSGDAGTVGNDRPPRVSPQHRMLLRGWQAQVLFGEEEVLVPALSLIDGIGIRAEAPGLVAYFHLLTPCHHIFAEGAEVETFLPGAYGLKGVEATARERLFAARPDLRADPDAYGPAARPMSRTPLTQLLVA
ncbi:Hint domain-containing protein [Jannaschia rubra]|uniref:Hedgehog/Intein (Hint) domain-containing protein n=1 Tax=Jannaschia rubra TaxID=282197 RepID=A0A0M6XLG7_9RHOB|nr:Hint domain-containing protein [Jannaschia rubra]CTQ32030.1 hypothetical protein JAN5088_00790 [Jannaschia rubra]SFG39394.1 Hint domain-containing protein [Jannaschia rubra]